MAVTPLDPAAMKRADDLIATALSTLADSMAAKHPGGMVAAAATQALLAALIRQWADEGSDLFVGIAQGAAIVMAEQFSADALPVAERKFIRNFSGTLENLVAMEKSAGHA